jgi:hypothetical protein
VSLLQQPSSAREVTTLAWNGNAVYRDIVRTGLLLDARDLALLVPIDDKPPSVKRAIPAFDYTKGLLSARLAAADRGRT